MNLKIKEEIKMKKFLLLFSAIFMLNSCTVGEDDNFHYEILPVASVDIPSEFHKGETYGIKVRYNRPSTCHSFNGFYYDADMNTRTIAIRTIVFEQNNCTPLTDNLLEQYINFYVTGNGPFLFKFWQGKNEAGEDVFLEYEVPVID